MDSNDFIYNMEGIPDTHCFIYKSKRYPIKYDFFKYSSKYFQDHHEEIQRNPNIQLIHDNSHSNYELTDEAITDFIKFVQCNKIKLTHENVVGINYLSTIYEIPTLKKHTEDYIKKNHQYIVVELLQKYETDKTFDKENYEEIIIAHLEDYIKEERLLNLKIPTLYRILTKYRQKNKISKEIIEFLFKILSKYGREASVLFSEVDFGDARIECVNRLLTDFSSNFDFHFINSNLLQTLYDANGEILRREEEHQKEIERMNLEIKRIEKMYKDEISKQKEETIKIVSDVKNELLNEINKLQKQLKNQGENQEKRLNEQKINEEKQNNSLVNEINQIKEEIKSIKTLQMKQERERKEKEEKERKEKEERERKEKEEKERKEKEERERKEKEERERKEKEERERKEKEERERKEKEEKERKEKEERERKEKERKERGIPLLLKQNEEFNGIIKYLTDLTKGNIHDNKTIEVTTSSNRSGAKNILDFNCDSFYEAESKDDLWICFDFKNRKVKVTNYSIKSHEFGKNNHHLKTWKIEVSNDGITWIKIDEHKNCPTLNGSCITGTFSVEPNDHSRFVRLHQTGTPWGGHELWFHYIEFYGYLREP